MYKNIVSILFPFALLVLMVSCDSKERATTELNFESIKFSDQVHLFGNDNFPALDMDLKLWLPADSAEYAGLYQVILQTYFDSLYHQERTAQSDMNLLADIIIQDYKSLEESLNVDSIEFGSSYHWQMVKENKILFKNAKYLSFATEEYSYTGGAHGNTISNHYIFDLEQNTLISPGDLLDTSKCEEIILLQKKSLEKAGQNIEGFWMEGFRCDANFYIQDNGLVFHYDQYEIASYAAGPMDIFVSFEEIKPYLVNPDILNEFTK